MKSVKNNNRFNKKLARWILLIFTVGIFGTGVYLIRSPLERAILAWELAFGVFLIICSLYFFIHVLKLFNPRSY
jgi:hypothetical protein